MADVKNRFDCARLEETMAGILDILLPDCSDIEYRLVGTGAALLQGVDLPAEDIDFLVRRRVDIDRIDGKLAELRCLNGPSWLPQSFQYYSSYEMKGIEVEFSTVEIDSASETIETFGNGPWMHYRKIRCGKYMVDAVRLELRLFTELLRNRPDRYEPLLRHLRKNGFEKELVRKGIAGLKISDAMKTAIAERLEI